MSAPTPARRAAYEVLRRVFEHGAYADRSLRSAAARLGLEGRERALAQRLAYGSVQRRGTSDHLVGVLAERPPERIDPPLIAALRLGLFELLFDDAAASHAAVDQAVELAKGGRDGGPRHRGAGLVNAVLRRAAREGRGLLESLDEKTPREAAVRHSIPEWVAELWWSERGEDQALALMRAANGAPIRTYRPLTTGVAERLSAAGARVEPAPDRPPRPAGGPSMIAVRGGSWEPVEAAVAAGELAPQSLGSALVVAALAPRPGDRVLDLCAAPGIKTTQLAATAGPAGRVVAVERDPGRARELEAFCERAGARNVRVLPGDGTRLELGSGYDRVLVDAPCTGLGTLASRPDARWRRSAADRDQLADLQARLLQAGCAALRPGGRAVYSVCTISRAEGEAVIERVVAEDAGLRVVDAGLDRSLADDRDRRFAQLLPDRDRTDGFFIAALERAA